MSVESGKGRIMAISDPETSPLFRSIGAVTVEASNWQEVLRAIRDEAPNHNAKIILVLKHLVEDEDTARGEAARAGATLLVLPSIQERAEPIDVNKLIARALGFG
ncbi:MAG: hypothetical protein F7B20_01910 [Aeropyrum sp.]|nr:hypothetical protein [Aeropyrum sp.]